MTTHPFPAEAAKRREISLRYWLLGKGFHRALRAMDFNQRLFGGTRKDGITPEFDHHICQAQYVRTLLPHLLYPEETLCVVFFHDTPEDKGLSVDEIRKFFVDEPEFGDRVAQASWKMTKKWRGNLFDEEVLFDTMGKCPISSIAKGCDRIHNFQSMVGVFSLAKQKSYLKEGDRLFLPMLKDAERRFPEQEGAYKNIRTFLKMQISLIRSMHDTMDQNEVHTQA